MSLRAPLSVLALATLAACEEVPATPGTLGCTGNGCCMPLTQSKKRDACEDRTCLPTGESVRHVEPADGRVLSKSCGPTMTNTDMLSFSVPGLSFVLHYQHIDCATPLSAASLRSALVGVGGEVALTDTRTGLRSVAMLSGGAEALDVLRIENGRLQLTFHAPVTSANMSSEIAFECGSTSGQGLPINVCNCVYEGEGPVVSLSFDVPMRPGD